MPHVSRKPTLTPVRRRLLRVIRDYRLEHDGGCPSLNILADLQGVTRYTVRDNLHNLHKLNLVWHEHNTQDWQVTPEGLAALDQEKPDADAQ